MESVFQAAIPVFGLIWIGYFFKRIHMPGDAFWPLAERITYYVFLPSLFFISILKADFNAIDNVGGILGATTVGLLLTSSVAFILQYGWLKLDGKRFASFYQGTIRFNNYIGIPIILSLFGSEGMVIYAIIIALSIPVTNALTVAVMTHYAAESEFNVMKVVKSIITNPLIVGSVGGVVVNLLNVQLFYGEQMIVFFASAASALGLLTVGAGIDIDAITSSKRNITVACVMKLAVNPFLIFVSCILFGVEGMARDVAIIYAALPVAASSYILARQFNAHAPLMASIIISTTLVAMGSLIGFMSLLALD